MAEILHIAQGGKEEKYALLYKQVAAVTESESDPIAAAKILKAYADKIETFNLVAGFVDGNVIDAKQVEELAKTPSKEVLLGRLLGSLQAPLYSLARVLTAVTEKDGAEPAAE